MKNIMQGVDINKLEDVNTKIEESLFHLLAIFPDPDRVPPDAGTIIGSLERAWILLSSFRFKLKSNVDIWNPDASVPRGTLTGEEDEPTGTAEAKETAEVRISEDQTEGRSAEHVSIRAGSDLSQKTDSGAVSEGETRSCPGNQEAPGTRTETEKQVARRRSSGRPVRG